MSYKWPLLNTVREYDRSQAGRDLLAACLICLLLVPQALAYAQLAGLPAVAGMYASILPLVAYALIGASPGVALSFGPVAVLALMTAAALAPIAAAGTAAYSAAAVGLTLLVGALLLLMGLLRLGFIANFLSHPVISGFVSGAAVLIAVSQLRYILGVSADGLTLPQVLPALYTQLAAVHRPTLLLGVASLVLLVLLRNLSFLGMPAAWAQRVKQLSALLVMLLAMAVGALLQLEEQGVKVVGQVPVGLPTLGLPSLELGLLRELLPAALLIALVGFVESISIAQSLAMRKRQLISPDLELLGQGAANVASAFSGGMPVAASFSRSAVARQSNMATPLVGIFAAGLMLAAVLGLAPVLRHLPQAVLAASILVAVLGLVDIPTLRHTWRYSKAEGGAQLATFFGVLLQGVEAGIMLGVVLSLLLFLWRTSRPHMAVVGQVPGSQHFRNIQRYKTVQSASVLSLRVDESLYFPNARYLEARIGELIAVSPEVRHLVLICSGVNQIDASALDALEAIAEQLKSAEVQLHLSEVKGPVMDRLKRSEFLESFGGQVFLSQYQALCTLDPLCAVRALSPE
ncbi:sulfate permease, SulP family [Pseudomonas guineae]|uniref:Sulfate permease, SulP family n=1 Tax=Pseudomonas guineae TaxID=425504 RepID=A0A1I3F4G9_9PSED|nr:sulfate permease [Pseudomonas guineae]SFI06146.1 sulfate permease, SulP family [Pseudomonas guineae]|tara:strand:+ start:2296 stop:4017 length:1722 start_codon:yes stop_codon:yes gene_type:complete